MESIIAKYGALIQSQIDYHKVRLRKSANSKSKAFHTNRAELWSQLLADLEHAQEEQPGKGANYALRPSDLNGLPQELLDELSLSESDQHELKIIDLIEKAGGVLSIERIMIDFYKATGQVLKRDKMLQKIYRLTKKGQLRPVEGKKAVYEIAHAEDSEK